MLTGADPAFDGPVILFQHIIEVLNRSMPAILLQSLLGFEPHDGRWITGVLVGVDNPRRRMVLSAQGLREKALSRCCVAFRPAEESRSSHPWSRQPGIQYTHLPLTRM